MDLMSKIADLAKNIDAFLSDLTEVDFIEYRILKSLLENDGQMASKLAISVGRVATSFTPILDRLENKGWVIRTPHANDRRAVKIFIAEGKALDAKALVATIDMKIEKLFKGLKVDEALTFVEAVITRIAQEL